MKKDELAEILKYSSPRILYIVAWNNVLIKLSCPFKVMVKYQIGELIKGQVVEVELVKVTINLTTVFIVNGRAYFYCHFEILVSY